MECEEASLAISARLDSEDSADPAELDAHLESCPACSRWQESIHQLTRRIRVGVAGPTPGVRAELFEEARRLHMRPARRTAVLLGARGWLVVVAAAQLALTVPMLVMGHDHEAPVHMAHEMGSLDLAVAAGFLVAAWRPRRAMGMLALVATAACLLVLTAVVDLAAGRTGWADEAPHLLVVAGWLLLRRLAITAAPGDDRPLSVSDIIRRVRRRPAWPSSGPAYDGRGADTGSASFASPAGPSARRIAG